MKANEAPEKIYLEAIYPDNGILPNGLNYNQSPNDIEYTRTDVFIEKACEWLKRNADHYVGHYINDDDTYMDESFIDNFRNYMKGEKV